MAISLIALTLLGSAPLPSVSASTGVTFISYTVGNSAAAVSSHLISLPANGTSGDLLITCLSVNGAPTITWPVGWQSILLLSSGTTITVSCDYRFDTGSLGTSFTVTTNAPQGDANVTYRVRNALPSVSPIVNVGVGGASGSPVTNTMTGTAGEERLIIAVFGWFAGTVLTSSYGPGLTGYTPAYPGIQSQWNNAAGTGIFTAYKLAAEDTVTGALLNFVGSVTSVRLLMAVRPAVANTPSIDHTQLWIILAIFLTLLGLGLAVHPIFQFMAGLAGLALTFEIFALTSDTLLASITAFMAIAILITSTLRDWR